MIAFKEGIHSEEMTTPLEAMMYRLIRILFIDIKLILSTVIAWGILCYFVKSINITWKNMIISITTIYIVVAVIFIYISATKFGRAIISDEGAIIYFGLLVPRLIFKRLKPGEIS
jgi:membrane protein YdbS with pleckstrin-like domain